jgi:hypothetical protein
VPLAGLQVAIAVWLVRYRGESSAIAALGAWLGEFIEPHLPGLAGPAVKQEPASAPASKNKNPAMKIAAEPAADAAVHGRRGKLLRRVLPGGDDHPGDVRRPESAAALDSGSFGRFGGAHV